MTLSDFLTELRNRDGIAIKFSHTGYLVTRHGRTLDRFGQHTHAVADCKSMRIRKVGNMYRSLAAASVHMSPVMLSKVGELMKHLGEMQRNYAAGERV
jgi:hypothetical protein